MKLPGAQNDDEEIIVVEKLSDENENDEMFNNMNRYDASGSVICKCSLLLTSYL